AIRAIGAATGARVLMRASVRGATVTATAGASTGYTEIRPEQCARRAGAVRRRERRAPSLPPPVLATDIDASRPSLLGLAVAGTEHCLAAVHPAEICKPTVSCAVPFRERQGLCLVGQRGNDHEGLHPARPGSILGRCRAGNSQACNRCGDACTSVSRESR